MTPPGPSPASALPWWLRLAARLSLPSLYAICGALAWLAWRVLRLRARIVEENLAACFPRMSFAERQALAAANYRHFGEVAAEAVASLRMAPGELIERVQLANIELPRALLATGRPVLLMSAHQANWEWLFQAMPLLLGFPVDVTYKPIKDATTDRVMKVLRGLHGANPVPAKGLVSALLASGDAPRGIVILADQDPRTSKRKHWMDFLGRDTAFYAGAEHLVRDRYYDAVYVSLRRVRRGYYEGAFVPLASAGESLESGEFTTRYARLVEQGIRAAPSEWTWGHRRWKSRRETQG
jgi:KDO2-lipid IV(A) lauroyltransferase